MTSNESEGPVVRARVHVFPRREILDPQGRAIHQSLGRLGFEGVDEVRAGKAFDISLRSQGGEQALAQLEEMARKLLSNPITEDFFVELLEGDAP